jgi:hypothetical protein
MVSSTRTPLRMLPEHTHGLNSTRASLIRSCPRQRRSKITDVPVLVYPSQSHSSQRLRMNQWSTRTRLAQTWTKTTRNGRSTWAIFTAAFSDDDAMFLKLWCGSVRLAKTESFTSTRGCRNMDQRDVNGPENVCPRRDASRRHSRSIFGKPGELARWWTRRVGWGCTGFVTKRRSKWNTQFIESDHERNKFGWRWTHRGKEMSHRSSATMALNGVRLRQ